MSDVTHRSLSPLLTTALTVIVATIVGGSTAAAQPAAPAPAPAPWGRRAPRSRWTRRARGSSTSARIRRTTPAAPTSTRDIARRQQIDARYARGLQGRHGLPEGHLSQQRRRHGHSRLPVPAAAEARRQAGTPRWSGCTAACTATGASRMFPFVKEAVERGYVIIAPSIAAAPATAKRTTSRSTTAARKSTTR